MNAVMMEANVPCPVCDGDGIVLLDDNRGCGDPDCCSQAGDCAECGGNGYVTVVAAVEPAPFSCDHPSTIHRDAVETAALR